MNCKSSCCRAPMACGTFGYCIEIKMDKETTMNQGAKRHAFSERGDDLYETPSCAVHTLLKHEPLPHLIWEPCAGRGAISKELWKAGKVVRAQDLVAYEGADHFIRSGIDFLMERKAYCDTIVTNPPFKLSDKFIRHGLDLGCTVIVLLRLMAIEGAGRADIIDKHLVRIWAGIERLPMMHRDGWKGRKIGNSGAPFAWFVFSPKARPKDSAIELRRVSWRDNSASLFALPEPAE